MTSPYDPFMEFFVASGTFGAHKADVYYEVSNSFAMQKHISQQDMDIVLRMMQSYEDDLFSLINSYGKFPDAVAKLYDFELKETNSKFSVVIALVCTLGEDGLKATFTALPGMKDKFDLNPFLGARYGIRVKKK